MRLHTDPGTLAFAAVMLALVSANVWRVVRRERAWRRQRREQRLRGAEFAAWRRWRRIRQLEAAGDLEAAGAERKRWHQRERAEYDLAVLAAYDRGAADGYGGATEPERGRSR